LNFVGKFDAKLPSHDPDAHSGSHFHADSPSTHLPAGSTHVPAGAIVVPDAHLLFGADFKRSGVDLVLSNDGHELVLHDYFKGEKRAALASPDGAHLTGDIVNALTGQVDYAQAGGGVGVAQIIGHVSKLAGSATCIRNGVAIILNNGDDVQKGDVVQSGSDSTVGITFIDGSVFGLSANARMVLNEMIYDPNGSNNSSLLSLVAGTVSFVAGETAKHGDMKVDTPVATMGIRGTAVLVQIDFNVPAGGSPDTSFQVLVEPDGTTGSYVLLDKTTLQPIATINQAGQQTSIHNGIISTSPSGLSPEIQKLIQDVFSIKFTDNSNTKSFEHYTDSVNPQLFTPIKLADGTSVTPIAVYANALGSSTPPSFNFAFTDVFFHHIDQAPGVVAFGGVSTERFDLTRSPDLDTATGTITFNDINVNDRPTAIATFSSFIVENAQHQNITATLTPQELAAVQAVAIPLTVSPNPGNSNVGSATWTYSLPDSAFDFLGAGETLTLTYLAQVNNNFTPLPQTSSQPIVITIVGSNDAPMFPTAAQTIAFTEGAGAAGLHANVPTSGTLTFDDPDLTDTHTVSVELLPVGIDLPSASLQTLEQALTVSIGTDSTGTGIGTIKWTLADLPASLGNLVPKGETLTLTFAVTVEDSQGATATQDITVTVTGRPDEAWIATAKPNSPPGGLWSDAANWETGAVPVATDDVIIETNPSIGLTPSYPVLIKDSAVAGTITMDDLGASAPQLINCSTLAVGGAFRLNADSIVYNSGTICVGGLMEVLDNSVLQNCGILDLQQGGDFKDHSTISNAGLIEVSGGTLDVQVDIANSGLIKVDAQAALTLDDAAIACGTVTNCGTLALSGSAALKSGVLGNSGHINVSGTGNALDHETITNTGALEIFALGALTLGQFTTVANAGGVITVDGTGVLTLNGATINCGTINDYSSPAPGQIAAGNIDVVGSSTISHASLNFGNVTIESGQTLTLDHDTVTGTTFTFVGTGTELRIDGPTLGGSIAGLAATDEIDLQAIGYGSNTTATYAGNAAGGVLTITDGAHSIEMTLVGDYLNAHFAGLSDGSGGTLITLNAADDAPVIAMGDKTEAGTVTERADKTWSSSADTASGAIHFTDIDLTDRPTATITSQSVTWTGGALTSDEIKAVEHAFSLTQADNANNGTVGWTYSITDSALDFLCAGQTATVTSTITLDDHQGGTDTATVTVTLHGADDAPVIAGETDPAPQTVILYQSPIVLAAGVSTNSLGMHTETFDSLSAGSASNNGFGHGSFYSEALHATFTASGDAGVVHGSSSGVSAAPLIGPLPGHVDTTNYLSIGAHGTETISFATEQNEFGLYWGSADSFNTISFYDGNKLVVSYSGTDVAPLLDNGNQGSFSSNGYVEFSDLAPFNKVVLASGSSNAFEIDNVSSGFVSDSHVHLGAPITGTLTVSDADVGDKLTATVSGDAVVHYDGSTTLPAGVNVSALIDPSTITFDSVKTTGGPDVLDWSYNPGNASLDFLEPGDTLTLAFKALVSDGHATTASQTLTVTLVGAGSAVVNGTAQNDTFVDVGGGVTIFGKGGQDNFAFNKDFGSATIGDFDVNHDTIDIDHSLFASVSALLASAHSANSGHDTIITDAAHDQITLSGVTLAQLQTHPNDFHLF
jgi:VCBS repeat-containing protein